MFNKITNWINEHLLHVQVLLLLAVIISCTLLKLFDKQDELIESLLIFIAIDFFILSIGYLEKIKKHTSQIHSLMMKKHPNIEFVNRGEMDWISIISKAKSDVFINGITLYPYVEGKKAFKSLKSNIHVRMMTLDVGDTNMLNDYRKMFYGRGSSIAKYINYGNIFKELYIFLKDQANVEFAVADRVTPICFFAVDIINLSSESFIRVQHHLYEKEAKDETISYIVRPGIPLFDVLREQIELLWGNAKREQLYFDE